MCVCVVYPLGDFFVVVYYKNLYTQPQQAAFAKHQLSEATTAAVNKWKKTHSTESKNC